MAAASGSSAAPPATELAIGAAAIAAGEAFAAALPGHEFAIPRQLVADAVVTAMHHEARPAERLEIEAELLLVEDC